MQSEQDVTAGVDASELAQKMALLNGTVRLLICYIYTYSWVYFAAVVFQVQGSRCMSNDILSSITRDTKSVQSRCKGWQHLFYYSHASVQRAPL